MLDSFCKIAQNVSNHLQERCFSTKKKLVNNIMGGKYIMDVKKRKEFILYIAKSFFSAYKDRVCQEEVLGVPPVLQPHT